METAILDLFPRFLDSYLEAISLSKDGNELPVIMDICHGCGSRRNGTLAVCLSFSAEHKVLVDEEEEVGGSDRDSPRATQLGTSGNSNPVFCSS